MFGKIVVNICLEFSLDNINIGTIFFTMLRIYNKNKGGPIAPT